MARSARSSSRIHHRHFGLPVVAAGLASTLALGGCAQARPTSAPLPTDLTPSAGLPSSPATTATPTNALPTSCAEEAATLAIEEQAGLVVLIGLAKAPDAATTTLIARRHLGGVVLTGPFKTGTAGVRAIVKQVDPDGELLIAAIQEGGSQQPLSGPGFDKMSAPNTQVGTPPIQLQAKWTTWGQQLRQAGVRLNLAPTGDVLSKKLASTSTKKGTWDRVYGADPEEAAQAVRSAVIGMSRAEIASTVTHFPGLGALGGAGRVGAGTTTDSRTKVNDASDASYRAATAAGVPALSVSTLTFTKFDKANPAVYSSRVIDRVRTDIGFTGAIVSDDLSAARLKNVDPATRVTRFIVAGGDLAYVRDAKVADAAVTGLVAAARADKAVAERLAQAAGNVLGLRAGAGLGTCQVIRG